MAGYIGNKAVGLNVTTGDILGDVGVGGDLDVDGIVGIGIANATAANNLHILGNDTTPSAHILLQSDDTANATAKISLFARTSDNSNKVAFIENAAGNLTLDSATGVIDFDDETVNFGRIENASSDFKIESRVQDKDIVFVGNDGGVGVTALTLDMSQAGEADFKGAIKVSGAIAAHQTNKGVLEFNNEIFLLRSYGGSAGSGRIEFNVGGGGGSTDVLAMTIEANKNVTIEDGNLVVGTADHGIQFAASTKNAGTSSVSNLMKDYEIGVWTPHLDTGGSITVHSAFYVRTGDLVHVQGYIIVTPTDNTNQFQIGGLPFLTQPGGNSYGAISISYFGNMDIASPNFITDHNSSDFMYLHRNDGNGATYTNANILGFGSLRAFIFGGTYRTAQ